MLLWTFLDAFGDMLAMGVGAYIIGSHYGTSIGIAAWLLVSAARNTGAKKS
jgi:hypothetical protein